MKIKGAKKQLSRPTVERFSTETFDSTKVSLLVKEDSSDKKTFVFVTFWQVLGFTYDATEAFEIFHNIPTLTMNELLALK